MLRDLFAIYKTFSRTERLAFFGSSALFVISLIFAGLIFFYTNTTVQPAIGGSYREGIVGQPIAINPVLSANNDADRDLIELTFTNLSTLLERYSTSTDGKTYDLILKPDLYWSDGEPLTSDDLIFTIESIQNPDSKSSLFSSWQGVVTERLSAREVRLTIRAPYVFFIDTINALKLIPQHIFEPIPVANLRLSNFILEPVGNGPYRYVSSEKEKTGFFSLYSFEENPYFAGDRVHIPRFEVAFFETYKHAIDAFNRKEISGLGGISPAQLSELKLVNQTFEFNIPRYYAIFFNQNVQPLLQEDAIRHALNLAINKKKLINAVFLNHALLVHGPILPYIEGYDTDIYANDDFSLELASSTLEKAGWALGGDGVRVKGTDDNAKRLELTLVVPQIPFLVETAEMIKADWQAIGVQLTLEVLPPLDINSSVITSRSYEMILFGNLMRGNADVFSFWHSSQRFQPGLNLSLYEDKTVDKILETIRSTTNEEKRAQLLSDLQLLIWENDPAIFLYSPTYLYVGPRSLGGIEKTFINTASERLNNVNKWYLKTNRVFN